MTFEDADARRAEMLDGWDAAAPGWARRARRTREAAMEVSQWLVDHLDLRPGQRVLELAAGHGDTGLLAAERIVPGGTLISSDASEPMLELARTRARELGVENVEFRQLQLEWIDLPAASVDAVVCKWGIMLVLDPDAAAREIRRVLAPGRRAAVAVWDAAEHNPWATIPSRAIVELGHGEPPAPGTPGPFALGDPARLRELLEDAGFTDVTVDAVTMTRDFADVDAFVEETLDLSWTFSTVWQRLTPAQRLELLERIGELAAPRTAADGSLELAGRTLVAAAGA